MAESHISNATLAVAVSLGTLSVLGAGGGVVLSASPPVNSQYLLLVQGGAALGVLHLFGRLRVSSWETLVQQSYRSRITIALRGIYDTVLLGGGCAAFIALIAARYCPLTNSTFIGCGVLPPLTQSVFIGGVGALTLVAAGGIIYELRQRQQSTAY